MNSERLTNTEQFIHKSITKPTITPVEKIMAAIADCAKAINNVGDSNGADKMQQLINLTDREVQHYPDITAVSNLAPITTANTRGTQPDTMVPPSGNQTQKNGVQNRWLADNSNDRRQTRSMTREAQPVPRVDQPPQLVQEALPRNNKSTKKFKQRRQRRSAFRPTVSASVPARNTRSHTRTATAPPSSRTRTKKGANRTGSNGRVETHQVATTTNGKISKKLENELHQSMAVVDAETGKLLNYKQLMR